MGDFNVSKVAKRGMLYTQTGTPYYASPEVWNDKPYDYKSDIWSLACVLYEMAQLRPPFKAADMKGLFRKVTAVDYPPISSRYSGDLSGILRTMLQKTPHYRPNCEQLLLMPVLQKNVKDGVITDMIREQLGTAKVSSNDDSLLDTIRVPR